MFGAIIVDPKDASVWPKADREFVLVQSEFWKNPDNVQGMFDRKFDNTIFNGGIFKYHPFFPGGEPLEVKVGERVRIYFVNAGPNEFSALHPIAEIWDNVYESGNPANKFTGVQTYVVGPGSAATFDMIVDEPGAYPVVTHSLTSALRGAIVRYAEPDAASASPATEAAPAKPPVKPVPQKAVPVAPQPPAVKGVTKDGISYTKDFDAKFLTAQLALLREARIDLVGQADRLQDEANQLIEEHEMGDAQFDEEGGEGDTMVVERERDLALSAQARQMVADIDAAMERLKVGTYGYSLQSGRPIPRERLEAIPWAEVLVEEKVGGIGRR